MTRGTNSLLFGAHQIFVHPLIVAYCWWKLYGFPYDPRLWLCFIVHDWGYFGMPNMDGVYGKWHPGFGGAIVGSIFGQRWGTFCILHSRYIANFLMMPPSKLCYADKLAIRYTPKWMYRKSELDEYLNNSPHDNYEDWRTYANDFVDNFVKDKDSGYGPLDYTRERVELYRLSIPEHVERTAAAIARNRERESKSNDSLSAGDSIGT